MWFRLSGSRRESSKKEVRDGNWSGHEKRGARRDAHPLERARMGGVWPETKSPCQRYGVDTAWQEVATITAMMLRSKGLKDATCVGWFGDDWDCSVGSPPEAMDHVSSAVLVGYAVYE